MSAQQAKKPGDNPSGRILPRRKSRRRNGPARYDGESPQFELKNKDPDVSYVWARIGDALGGVGNQSYYENVLGYQVVAASDDPASVRPLMGGGKPGEPFIRQDMILMGIHREDRAILEEEGHDGRGGALAAQEMSRRLGQGRSPGDENSIDPHINMQGYESSQLVREQSVGG